MSESVVKNVIKYVKTHFEPFTSEELAVAIGVSVENAERAIGYLAYLGIVEIDERDGRIFSSYESDFIVKFGTLVKYIGDEECVVIPEGVNAVGLSVYKPSDLEYGVPSIWNWALTSPKEIVIPSTVTTVAEDAFSDLPSNVTVVYPDKVNCGVAFKNFCKELCSDKYVSFFSDKSAEYMIKEGDCQPYYIGTAKEFCDFFTEKYKELYLTLGLEGSPVKDELDRAYGEYDYILQGDDLPGKETIEELTAVEVVALLSVIFDMEQFNTGYIEHIGKSGFVSCPLTRLKNALSEESK